MSLLQTLQFVVGALDESGIPHMISGSIASAHHGEARSTQDIDVVIDPTRPQLDRFVELVRGEGLYCGDGRAALVHRSQFNVIDTSSGWKVDLIIKQQRPFSSEEFRRRRATEIGGVRVYLVTPEDSILSKLEWGAPSGSERQMADAASIVSVRGEQLDWDYLLRWAPELGVLDQVEQLRATLDRG